jgi:hypothetical protein
LTQKTPANPVFISLRGFFEEAGGWPKDGPEGYEMLACNESLPSHRFFEQKITKGTKERPATADKPATDER